MTSSTTLTKPVPAAAGRRSDGCPPAGRLVAEARLRLAEELEQWPAVSSALLWARLLSSGAQRPSAGAQVHFIRAAHELQEQHIARELFVLLLQQIESACARWAAGCISRTPAIPGAEGILLQEELRQELALRLWEQIGLRSTPGWELFFRQSLAFAEKHTATVVMQHFGYWPVAGVALPERAAQRLRFQLVPPGADLADRLDGLPSLPPDEGTNPYSAAELVDLRRLVGRLPGRLRTAILLRYWHDASEAEIGRALGGVTTRTVRNYLRQGHALLRDWYGGESEVTAR